MEVNHHIRLVNQMRFPHFDDLEAALAQFLSEADCRRLVMAYDFKGAHRFKTGLSPGRLRQDICQLRRYIPSGSPRLPFGGRGWLVFAGMCDVAALTL